MTMSRFLSTALLCLLASRAAAVEELSIFVSLKGADTAKGDTAASAVKTLQRAIDISLEKTRATPANVLVSFAGGEYGGQRATIGPISRGSVVSIERGAGSGPVVFRGDGKGGTWLTVTAGGPQGGAVHVKGVVVTNYTTAISLEGSRDQAEKSVTNVVIDHNIFRGIGQIANPKGKPATAAIRLVNADQTEILNNQFIDVRNIEKCGLIHSIYMAHGSTNNVVKGNLFENGCGDAIRFRDGSSNNKVTDNKFIDAWAESPISDWYCDASDRDDCTKASAECPSFGNELVGNQIVAKRAKSPKPVTAFGPDSTPLCPAPSADRKRFVAR
jgi:Right handed beta helix region